MRKFSFRLQPVLDHRLTVEEKLLAELGMLRRRLAEERNRLACLVGARAGYWQWLSTLAESGASAISLRSAHEFVTVLSDAILLQQLEVENAERQVDEKLAQVIEASKDRKVMQRLREKRYQEHKQAAEREDLKFLDEIASVRFARTRHISNAFRPS